MPWHLWLQQQISLGLLPNEQRGPPALHREMPNRNHMQLHADPSADTITATQRMLGYLQSNLPWSTYLNTLPPIARRHYLNMPPNHSDVHLDMSQPHDQPPTATRSSLNSLGGYPPPPAPTATTSLTTRDPVVTCHNLSRPGGYNSEPTAAKRRHTDPPTTMTTAQLTHNTINRARVANLYLPHPNATKRDPIPEPNRPRTTYTKQYHHRQHTRTPYPYHSSISCLKNGNLPAFNSTTTSSCGNASTALKTNIPTPRRTENPTIPPPPTTITAQLQRYQAHLVNPQPTQPRPQLVPPWSSNRVHPAPPPPPMTPTPPPPSRTPPQQIQPTA